MFLPDTVTLCDAVELAAINLGKNLSDVDIAKQFFPGQEMAEVEADIHDVFELAKARKAACPSMYPFDVTDRSISSQIVRAFNTYIFLLLGRSLDFGGPATADTLLRRFRKYFEDVVRWAFRKSGLVAEVLSIPRAPRGLSTELVPALREIATRFVEPAILREDRLMPHDNDLDVDVLAIPLKGNGDRGGWPTFQIQCATGEIKDLESKISEGALNFGTVWEKGFFPGCRVRGAATPDDLIILNDVYWHRLGQAGWILDRTRIAYLAGGRQNVRLPQPVREYWQELWAARSEISWQTGWQGGT